MYLLLFFISEAQARQDNDLNESHLVILLHFLVCFVTLC